MKIGEKLRLLREAQGISQTELAQIVGCSQTAISQYEGGSRNFPADEVERFADALGIEPAVFYAREPWNRIDAVRSELETVMDDVVSILRGSAHDSDDDDPHDSGLRRRKRARLAPSAACFGIMVSPALPAVPSLALA